jgi:hypothetical protein
MDELEEAIVALLKAKDFDLGMKPSQIAERLGSDVESVSSALESLRRAGRAHPTSFGNWDHGPDLPPPDASQTDQG